MKQLTELEKKIFEIQDKAFRQWTKSNEEATGMEFTSIALSEFFLEEIKEAWKSGYKYGSEDYISLKSIDLKYYLKSKYNL